MYGTVAINGTAAQFDGSDSYTDEEMPITDWAGLNDDPGVTIHWLASWFPSPRFQVSMFEVCAHCLAGEWAGKILGCRSWGVKFENGSRHQYGEGRGLEARPPSEDFEDTVNPRLGISDSPHN